MFPQAVQVTAKLLRQQLFLNSPVFDTATAVEKSTTKMQRTRNKSMKQKIIHR